MIVPIVNKSNHRLPEYAHPGDAGMDLKANLDTPIVIRPGENAMIPTGIATAIPEGYYVDIRCRSGLMKNLIWAAPGTIDSCYRGPWFINLVNLGRDPYMIHPGDRIAQAILTPYETVEWKEVRELEDTERGANGFGSSGID